MKKEIYEIIVKAPEINFNYEKLYGLINGEDLENALSKMTKICLDAGSLFTRMECIVSLYPQTKIYEADSSLFMNFSDVNDDNKKELETKIVSLFRNHDIEILYIENAEN